MTDQKPTGAFSAGGLRTSRVIMIAALLDLLVIVPYSSWRLRDHQLILIIVTSIEGIAVLSLLVVALYLRRRGS
jgi:hypothetical protein